MFRIFKNLFAGTHNGSLKEALSNGAYLVDVRTAAEFADGSIQNAVNIPLDKLVSQLSKFKGKKNIVIFCRSGVRSSQAKRILESNGIQNVINAGSLNNVLKAINQ
ncbi:MAG TPA: rhodanese-like domain-containing protein [Ferruginibacter sp.]|nr:rhodanese-like domain-containing protein [Ferruginibacter sp.]HRE63778.1 rhodanese-like domain-containing protein [Ferruginibacter sp.]